MSETTIPVSGAKAETTPFSEWKIVKGFSEFFFQFRVAMSIHLNRVTKFNSFAVAIVILAIAYLVTSYINMKVLDMSIGQLVIPLNILTLAGQTLILSYLFPIVHHVLSFYQDKKDDKWKAEVKARRKAEKLATKEAKIAQQVANGDYVI
jgi:hypothetical protein